jgi:hypothetical protein
LGTEAADDRLQYAAIGMKFALFGTLFEISIEF